MNKAPIGMIMSGGADVDEDGMGLNSCGESLADIFWQWRGGSCGDLDIG